VAKDGLYNERGCEGNSGSLHRDETHEKNGEEVRRKPVAIYRLFLFEGKALSPGKKLTTVSVPPGLTPWETRRARNTGNTHVTLFPRRGAPGGNNAVACVEVLFRPTGEERP
jgi:hypothetical protein